MEKNHYVWEQQSGSKKVVYGRRQSITKSHVREKYNGHGYLFWPSGSQPVVAWTSGEITKDGTLK